jgi:hypothetical protein
MLKASLWEQGLYYPNKKLENHEHFNAISLSQFGENGKCSIMKTMKVAT